jgi:diguanylate cyclase (GGDEF)-like protein
LLNARALGATFCEPLMSHRDLADGLPVSLLYVDVDDLKRLNDQFGHLAGDQLIVSIAQTIVRAAPEIAVVHRVSGEEFVVLHGLDREELEEIAQVIRRDVEARALAAEGAMRATISLGGTTITHVPPDLLHTPARRAAGDLLGGALRVSEAAQRDAKLGGRNRYEFRPFDTDTGPEMM